MQTQDSTHPLTSELPKDFVLGHLTESIANIWAARQRELLRGVPSERSEAHRKLQLLGERIRSGDFGAIFPVPTIPEGKQ